MLCCTSQMRGEAGLVLPQNLLQEVAVLQLQASSPRLTVMSHQLLCELLRLTLPQGCKEPQALALLSACWHAVSVLLS